MEKLRTLLLNRLFNFWKDSVDNKEDFKNQLREIIFDNGIDGAETLLDFCREDFEEIPIEEQENGEHEDLNKIWDICNWYLDLLQKDNVSIEWLINEIENF